jgi:hypothetical protein
MSNKGHMDKIVPNAQRSKGHFKIFFKKLACPSGAQVPL